MSSTLDVLDDARLTLVPAMLPSRPWSTGTPTADTRLLGHGQVFQVRQDHQVYAEGDPAENFFRVQSGVVRVCKFLRDGRRLIDAFHGPDEVCGFEAASHYRRTAEAVGDCTLIAYRRAGVDSAAVTDPALARQLLSYAMRGMIRAQDHSLLLGRKGAVEKVAAFLMEWARYSPGSRTIWLVMTRQDIADYLGLTIETISRSLSQLERQDVIELPSAREIRLKDPAALRRLDS
jgi:CRP/FNR family nitrogen fixation transcriptional regulator